MNAKSGFRKCKDAFNLVELKMMPISQFIQEEFVIFSLANLHRSIPRLMDGLKVSQRKIMWVAYYYWILKKAKKDMKVAQLEAKVAEQTKYHHGEKNLEKLSLRWRKTLSEQIICPI